MATNKTYKGQLVALEHYKAMSVIDYEFDLYDDLSTPSDTDDDTPLVLSVYDYISLKIYAKQHGTLLVTASTQTGELTVSSNSITWDQSKTIMDLRPSEYYWHVCVGRHPGGQVDLLFYGPSEVI